MERIALQMLVAWNENKKKKPLIVWGARQVGKTYLVKDIFAEEYYKENYIYIDCKIEDEIRSFCSAAITNERHKNKNIGRTSRCIKTEYCCNDATFGVVFVAKIKI